MKNVNSQISTTLFWERESDRMNKKLQKERIIIFYCVRITSFRFIHPLDSKVRGARKFVIEDDKENNMGWF